MAKLKDITPNTYFTIPGLSGEYKIIYWSYETSLCKVKNKESGDIMDLDKNAEVEESLSKHPYSKLL